MANLSIYLSGRKFKYYRRELSKSEVQQLFKNSPINFTYKPNDNDVIVYAEEPSTSSLKKGRISVKFLKFAKQILKVKPTDVQTLVNRYKTKKIAMTFKLSGILPNDEENPINHAKNQKKFANYVKSASMQKKLAAAFKRELPNIFRFHGIKILSFNLHGTTVLTSLEIWQLDDDMDVIEDLDFAFNSDGWDIQYEDRLFGRYEYSAIVLSLKLNGKLYKFPFGDGINLTSDQYVRHILNR